MCIRALLFLFPFLLVACASSDSKPECQRNPASTEACKAPVSQPTRRVFEGGHHGRP